ncbi:MAG: MarR family transcriptional regulator [Gemmatimonadetes bacterium]|nr:MarR family transcriptional regulator [Gemmatimonadota bacterium]
MPPRVTLQRLHARDPATMLALLTFIKLRRAGNTINAILAAPLVKEHNLTESQFGVLEALWHVGPMAQARLCEKLLVSGSNLTTVIDNLEKRGLVVRGPNPDDRRAYLVRLAPKGEALIAKAFPPHAARVTRLLGVLTQSEQRQLGTLCRKLGLSHKE